MSKLVPPYPIIRGRLNAGKIIPFLGSGASLGGRKPQAKWQKGVADYLPTAGELAGYLAEAAEFPADEQPDLAKVAQYFSVISGRQILNEELRAIFDFNYPLTALHTYLADVPAPLLIVTTNYDDCIERAFDAVGRAYDLVVHTTDAAIGDQLLWWEHGAAKPAEVIPNELDIDLAKVTVIYKMHGTVDRRTKEVRDQYLITEDDYIDFLARMTKNTAVPAIFAEPFQQRHFLFLGYSLSDWNLRVVLNRIEKDLRRPKNVTSWAIRYQAKPLEQLFWQKRSVEVYDMTIEEFMAELVKPKAGARQ